MNNRTQSCSSASRALVELTAAIRGDCSILPTILCGSLSHDAVWKHSDIDLGLITIDDLKIERSSIALDAGGLNVHAFLVPRAGFRKMIEVSLRNSFMHPSLAKGRLLYSHDETTSRRFDDLHHSGRATTP